MIRLNNVSKTFKLSRKRNQLSHSNNLKTVLCNLNLSIKEGESVSVLGGNGAGKSTLLKIICGITKPSKGSIDVYNKPHSLLELGSLFHDQLTGVENIYLYGSIYGLKKSSIDNILDYIIEFSDLDECLTDPLYTYSSGMKLRLAFSVIANLKPKLLIIDEALSVGDMFFRKKCFEFLENYILNKNTLIFASHNEEQIRLFSKRSIVIHNSKIIFDGDPSEAIFRYHELNDQKRNFYFNSKSNNLLNKENLSEFFNSLFITDENNKHRSRFIYNKILKINAEIKEFKEININLGIVIRNKEGVLVYSKECQIKNTFDKFLKVIIECPILFGRNSYFIDVYIVNRNKAAKEILFWMYNALSFVVEYSLPVVKTGFKGGIWDINSKYQIEKV